MGTQRLTGESYMWGKGKKDVSQTAQDSPKTWGSVWVEELMDTNVIGNRNMAILKEQTSPSVTMNPALLSDLRHDKGIRSSLCLGKSKSSNSEIMMEAKKILKNEEKFKKIVNVQNKLVDDEVDRFQNHISNLRKMNQRLERIAFPSHNTVKKKLHLNLKCKSYDLQKGENINDPDTKQDYEVLMFREQERSRNKTANQYLNERDKTDKCEPMNDHCPPLKNKIPLLISGHKMEDEILQQSSITFTNFSSERQTMVFETIHQKYMESERNRILNEEAMLIRHTSPIDDCEKDLTHHATTIFSKEIDTSENFSDVQLQEWTDESTDIDLKSYGAQKTEVCINQWCLPMNPSKGCDDSKRAVQLEKVATSSTILPPPIASRKPNLHKLESMSRMYAKWMSNVCVPSNVQLENSFSLKNKQEKDRKFTRETFPKCITREEKIMQVLHALRHKEDNPKGATEIVHRGNSRFSKSVNDIHEDKIEHEGQKFRRAISGTYENRLKAHKDVILHQKAKLDEQKKQIEDLKLSQLKMESEKSKLQTQKTFNQVLKSCDENVKAQAKSLQSSFSLVDLSPDNAFVFRMEQRALEQRQKKLLAQERRKRFEEEWKKKMKENEEKKRLNEEEMIKKQNEEVKEMRRKEREIREDARRERERFIALERKADQFSELRKLKKGLLAFKNLLALRKNQEKMAEEFYKKQLLHTFLNRWQTEVEVRQKARLACADSFYYSNLIQRCFNALQKEVQEGRRCMQVAMDMYDFHLQERYFRAWLKFTERQRELTMEKMSKADQHFSKVIVRKYLYYWQRFPEIAQQEREKERRKMVWRSKVQQLLPDFRPICSSD